MRHVPAIALALALAGLAALHGPEHRAPLGPLALFSFAVSAFRTRIG